MLASALAGCTSSGGGSPNAAPNPTSVPVATSASETGPLPRAGDCFAPEGCAAGASRPVPCDSPDAEAKVLTREVAGNPDATGSYRADKCDDDADFILDVEAHPPTVVWSGQHRTYVCMRTLKPPHAADPGGGRSPIVAGDCVYAGPETTEGPFTSRNIIEFRCAEAALHQPAYKVFAIGPTRGCPAGTGLTFTISPFLEPTKAETACANPV
jgi:hypothetical protein